MNASSGGSPPRSAAHNARSSLITQLTTAALTAVLTLVLVRVLDPAGYGLFALALSLGGLVLLPADFGINNATARLIAQRRNDTAAVRGLFLDALRVKLVVAGALSVGLFLLAGPIAGAYDTPALVWPLRLVAVAVLGQTLVGLLGATAISLGRAELNLRVVGVESLLEVTASIALVLAGGGAAGAALGRAIGYGVGFLLGLLLILRFLGWHDVSRPAGSALRFGRRIAAYAGALLIVDAAFTLFTQINVLLIGGFLGTAAVGVFHAPSRLLLFLHYPGYAIANGIAPLYASDRGGPADPEMLLTGIRVIILVQLPLTVPTIVWAGPIVDLLLGSDFGASASVLAALAPFTFLQGIGPIVSLTLNYVGEARRRVPIAVAAVFVNAAIGVLLIPTLGVVGGALSTDVAYLLYVAGHLWVCRRLLELPLRPLAKVMGRGLMAAAGMAGVLVAFGTNELSVFEWFAGGGCGVAAYLGLLRVTGELTAAEFDVARQYARARLRAGADRHT